LSAPVEVGNLVLRRLTGDALEAAIPDLARLRIEVFRAFPYLYDGDAAYEARYLQAYVNASDSVLIAAYDGARIVGASTGLPLEHETSEVTAPFLGAGVDPATIFYFGESVLEAPYRGVGAGVAFFKEREAFARASSRFSHAAFCAVERPADHPRRPEGYQPLDAFWRRRGYAPVDGLRTVLSWKDLDETAESPKPMQVWMKPL